MSDAGALNTVSVYRPAAAPPLPPLNRSEMEWVTAVDSS